jgi:hypothetical protein
MVPPVLRRSVGVSGGLSEATAARAGVPAQHSTGKLVVEAAVPAQRQKEVVAEAG